MKQIDHIYIEFDEETQNATFNKLTKELKFPVAWPISDYGVFSSGAVSLGNLNLELVKFKNNLPKQLKLVTGIALAPDSLDKALNNLNQKHVLHGDAIPFTVPDSSGTPKLAWTNVSLPEPLKGHASVFICAYAFDLSSMNSQNSQKLESIQGGPLGLIGVKELLITTPEPQTENNIWEKILQKPQRSYTWTFAEGPSVRIQSGPSVRVELILNVHSVEVSQEKFNELNLEDLPIRFTKHE